MQFHISTLSLFWQLTEYSTQTTYLMRKHLLMTMKRLIRRELANVNDKFIALKDFLKNYFLWLRIAQLMVTKQDIINKTCSSTTITFPLMLLMSLPLKTKLILTLKQLPDMAILRAEYISEKHNLTITYMHPTQHLQNLLHNKYHHTNQFHNFSCVKAEASKRTLLF